MPELNETEIRQLFKKAGHEQAPCALHAAVMEQVMAADTAPVVKPLIASREWILVGLALAAISSLAWFLSATVSGDATPGFASALHVDLSVIGQALQSSKWIALAMGLAFALTVIDRVLSQAQHRTSH